MTTSKLKTIFAFAFLTLFTFSVHAQQAAFKVTSIKGVAKADGKRLFVGSKVMPGQTITVEGDALVNVVHTGTNKPLNISKAGSYKADDLAKACSAPKGSLSEKYAAFVLNELTSGKNEGVNGDKMSKTGSVKRTLTGVDKSPINFMANKKTEVAGNETIVIKWESNDLKVKPEEIKSYVFVVTDLMSNELFKEETSEPQITLDLSDEKLAKAMGGAFNYHVLINGDANLKSAEYIVKFIDGEEAIQIKQDVASLSDNGSALNKMILAKYFEDKGLVANAMYAYEEAVKLSGNDEMYQNLYQAFLDRNYLKNKTKKKTASTKKVTTTNK